MNDAKLVCLNESETDQRPRKVLENWIEILATTCLSLFLSFPSAIVLPNFSSALCLVNAFLNTCCFFRGYMDGSMSRRFRLLPQS